MKSLILSIGTLFVFLLSMEFASAQTTSCNPADCAKVTTKATASCNPADCAKVCANNPACNPANCSQTANASMSPVEAAIAILVNNKKESSKTSCCSQGASCASAANATKTASVQKEAKGS